MTLSRLLLVGSITSFVGCGSDITTDAGVDAGDGATDSSSQDAVTDSIVDGGAWHFFDSSGDCAPDVTPRAYSACCNDQPCNGTCMQNEVGDVQCWCAGPPGCPDGLVCCSLTGSCISSSNCIMGP